MVDHETYVILNKAKNLIVLQRGMLRGSAAPLNMTILVNATTT